MKQKMMLNKDQRGFSLIELIIVMAIMAVLLALLVPRLSRYLERSRSAACLADMSQIAKEYAIDQYLEADIPDGLIQKIADEYGAVKAAGSSRAYTGLCPSGGIYVFDNYADGSRGCGRFLGPVKPTIQGYVYTQADSSRPVKALFSFHYTSVCRRQAGR